MHLIAQSWVLFLWMHTLTLVKSQDCTLEQFINGPLYDSNFDTTGMLATYAAGKQVRVSCNVGFSGFFRLLCIEGEWKPRGAKCQPRSCGHPGEAQFAEFRLEKGDDFVFGSEVVYTCQKGYQMVSRTNYRRCMAEGWDGVVPVCEAQQCPVIHVDDNVQVTGDPEEATYGNVLRFRCKSNSLVLDGLSEIHCDDTGEWSGIAPTCKEVKCAAPVIENGQVRGNVNEYKENEVLSFQCNPRYKSTESRPSRCTKVGLRAEWSPTPLCEPVTCTLTWPPISGTRYEPDSRSVFSPGDTVTVTCEDKFWIFSISETSRVATCTNDGTWDHEPVCQEVRCEQPGYYDHVDFYQTPYYRWQRKTEGDTVDYRCKRGYKTTDDRRTATCTRDGWTPKPLCKEIKCDKPDIPNADIIGGERWEYKYNNQVQYACRDGYEGRFTITCAANGWQGDQSCREIKCNKPDIPNADIIGVEKWEYKYRNQVQYACRDGYEGRFTITCTASGWEGVQSCREKTCTRPPGYDLIHNFRESDWRRRLGATQSYTCKTGYKNKDGMDRATCTADGWMPNPLCEDSTACSKPQVENGFAVGPYDGMFYYTCNEGYKLYTKGWWNEAKCVDGVLSEPLRCIDQRNCGKIPEIPNAVKPSHAIDEYRERDTIAIECKKGYNSNLQQMTCLKGQWDLNGMSLKTICTPLGKPCNPPPKFENAIVMISYRKKYFSGTEVTYNCRDKYATEGEDRITCKDGEWENKNIKCIQYCEKPKDEEQTMTITVDRERYMNGDVLEYKCIAPGVKPGGNAICVNGTWSEPIECKVQPAL